MKQPGFTLLELVIAMAILGIMAVFSVRFIQDAVAIYQQGSAREQLMSDVRFGLERLNREVRDAVPGSLRIEKINKEAEPDAGPCVRFWPILAVSRHSGFVDGTNQLGLRLPKSDEKLFAALKKEHRAIIFPLGFDSRTASCDGSEDCVGIIKSNVPAGDKDSNGTNTLWLTTIDDSKPNFVDTDTRRVYFAREQVRYCFVNNQLRRESADLPDDFTDNLPPMLMGERLEQGRFKTDFSGLYQQLRIEVTASRNTENLEFNHIIRLYNAP